MPYPNNARNAGPNRGSQDDKVPVSYFMNIRDPSADGESTTKVGTIRISAYNDFFTGIIEAFDNDPESMETFIKGLVIDIKSAKPAGGGSAFLDKMSKK